MESSLATSSANAAACPPAAVISAASSASFASLRAARATVAPALASSRAHARPIPWLAPVTSAILPCNPAIRPAFIDAADHKRAGRPVGHYRKPRAGDERMQLD